jgi:MFS family permease
MSYTAVLSAPHAARTFGAALVGRLSYGIVFLSLVLAVTRSTGSYPVAGGFLALFGLTSSVLSPARARIIDRYGLRRALTPMAAAYAALLAAIAAVTWHPGAPHPLLWVLAGAAGSLTPPLGPVMRSLWSGLIAGEELRRRAFSLDTVAEELLYVTGPLLAGLLAAVANPALGVAVSAALVLLGSLLLVTSPAVADRPVAAPPAGWGGVAGLAAPVLVSAALGMCLGGLGLLLVAFAAREHHPAAVAWVEAALAAGSAVGGLVHGAVTWRRTGRVRLPLLAAAAGAPLAVAGLAGNLVGLVALVGLAGLFVAPALTTAYLIADETAAPAARTQAGAWVNTAFNLANAAGAALAGVLLGRVPLALCFAIIALPAIATLPAAGLAGGRRSARR